MGYLLLIAFLSLVYLGQKNRMNFVSAIAGSLFLALVVLWPYILIGWFFQAQAANITYSIVVILLLLLSAVSHGFRKGLLNAIRKTVMFGAAFFLFPFKN